MKNIAKSKSVSVYIEHKDGDKSQILVCDFDENGYITVTSEFDSVVNENEIDKLFIDTVNPIIQEVKNLLEQSGYKLNKFNSLHDENIEIKQLTYESNIEISKPIILEPYKGCISSLFNNESSEYKSGIHLRLKRVSNFNKVTSQEAFILEKSEQGYRGNEIIIALLENFPEDLDRTQAEDLVRKIANEIQVERGVRKSDIKIKENPGFKTTILLDQKTSVIKITVENINDINYLLTIPIYLDSIIRLTQDKTSTAYPVPDMNRFCSSGEQHEINIPDIISPTESSASEIPSIEEDVVEYKIEKDKPTGAFNLFYDEDEYEDEEDEEDE